VSDTDTTISAPGATIRAVTVFCGSSDKSALEFAAAAADLGRAIGAAGWTLVYGGNRIGLMGILADSARAAGARVVGITPQYFLDHGHGDNQCDELIVSTTMRDRKEMLEQRGDAFIALPGGLGTLDEIFDILATRTLGWHEKPLILLNINGFYEPLLAMIQHGIDHHFIKPRARTILHAANTVDAAMRLLARS